MMKFAYKKSCIVVLREILFYQFNSSRLFNVDKLKSQLILHNYRQHLFLISRTGVCIGDDICRGEGVVFIFRVSHRLRILWAYLCFLGDILGLSAGGWNCGTLRFISQDETLQRSTSKDEDDILIVVCAFQEEAYSQIQYPTRYLSSQLQLRLDFQSAEKNAARRLYE